MDFFFVLSVYVSFIVHVKCCAHCEPIFLRDNNKFNLNLILSFNLKDLLGSQPMFQFIQKVLDGVEVSAALYKPGNPFLYNFYIEIGHRLSQSVARKLEAHYCL